MDYVEKPSTQLKLIRAGTLEDMAQLLRDNGYHVVPRDRVNCLTVSRAIPLDTVAYLQDTDSYMPTVKYGMGRDLGHEIISGRASNNCVLWSQVDHEGQRIHQAQVRLIIPKDAHEHQREAEHPSAVRGDHAERPGARGAEGYACDRLRGLFGPDQGTPGIYA